MTKRALITGVNGQDGSYLAEWLMARGYDVYGLDRRPRPEDLLALARLKGFFRIDLMEPGAIRPVLREVRPDEVYYLAAHHFSSQTDENRVGSIEPFFRVNFHAAADALEVIAAELPATKFFYPASAQVFGPEPPAPQDEATPRRPDTPYGISKSAAMDLCRYFRHRLGVFASVGILYNHESPRRPDSFVTTQIARAAARAASGDPAPLVVRDLEAVVDWGAAEDYVRAIWLTLQQGSGDEFIIASGQARTVREFAEVAYAAVGLRAADHVRQRRSGSPVRPSIYVGDSSKIRRVAGWKPEISFDGLVRSMVEAQQARLEASSA